VARYRVGLETRARILAATRDVLGEHGLDSTTLKAITDRAGIGAGSFYNLFDSKEAAVLEVLREAIVAIDPDPAGMGREGLDDLIDAFVGFVTSPETAALARIHVQLASSALTDRAVADRMVRSHRRRVERFAAAIVRDQGDVDQVEAERHAEILLAALTGLALQWIWDPTFDFAGHAARLPRRPLAPVDGA
jgi:AcrR family transcriptional regulator